MMKAKAPAARRVMILVALAFVALLPMMILRDFTPANELRYLSIADEAMRNGHLFAFTFCGDVYADKPPLYLWAVMFCKWLVGSHQMWLLSLLSFIPAAITLIYMDKWMGERMSDRGRTVASVMTLMSAIFVGSAVTLRMDMMMTMFIVLALRSFWIVNNEPTTERGRVHRWLFPIFIFLGVFSKGPFGLLIPLVSTSAYLVSVRQWRRMGMVWGWRTWVVVLTLCGGWFAGVWADGGSEYLQNMLFHQTVGRGVNAFTHSKPFFYYLLTMWYGIAPWSLATLIPLIWAMARRRIKSDEAGGLPYFCGVVSVSTLVMLSCVSSKLAIYLLPAFPFMIYGGVWAMAKVVSHKWLRATIIVPSAVGALALPAVVVMYFMGIEAWVAGPLVFVGAGLLTAGSVAAICLASRRGAWIAPSTASLAGGMLAAAFVVGLDMPRINEHVGFRALCRETRKVMEMSGCHNTATWALHRVAGMDVYLGSRPNELDSQYDPCSQIDERTVLMIKTRDVDKMPTAPMATVGPYAVLIIEPQADKTNRQPEEN